MNPKTLNSSDLYMAKFCHWILTMSQAEAAFISQATLPYQDDKEKVAVFTVLYYRETRG